MILEKFYKRRLLWSILSSLKKYKCDKSKEQIIFYSYKEYEKFIQFVSYYGISFFKETEFKGIIKVRNVKLFIVYLDFKSWVSETLSKICKNIISNDHKIIVEELDQEKIWCILETLRPYIEDIDLEINGDMILYFNNENFKVELKDKESSDLI